jgi:hypothetical protein
VRLCKQVAILYGRGYCSKALNSSILLSRVPSLVMLAGTKNKTHRSTADVWGSSLNLLVLRTPEWSVEDLLARYE